MIALYEDGANLAEKDSSVVLPIIKLLKNNFYIAIITAAGYPKQSSMYETRFSALLKEFEKQKFGYIYVCLFVVSFCSCFVFFGSPEILNRFWIIGGECNYLLKCNEKYQLEYQNDGWLLPSYK
jgi:IMP and pyridine-specific 5'-nucleotidase